MDVSHCAGVLFMSKHQLISELYILLPVNQMLLSEQDQHLYRPLQ